MLWEVTHEQVLTDRMGFSRTVVEADTEEEAMEKFNKKVADGIWTLPISDTKNIKPLPVVR